MIRLRYAPEFVEETVLLAERTLTPADRQTFRRARNPLYEIGDDAQREERFRALHLEWFERLGFPAIVERAVRESLSGQSVVDEARVLPAATRDQEGADLVDQIVAARSGTKPMLIIRLRPALVLDGHRVRTVLAHELLHVHDMLDPDFGYERSLPIDGGPLTETALRDRYRVLWDTTIDGRLVRAGVLDDAVRTAREREFAGIFPMLGPDAPQAFAAWFDRDRPTHQAMVAFARSPEAVPSEVHDASIHACV